MLCPTCRYYNFEGDDNCANCGADLAMAFRVPRAGGARGAIAFDHGAATVRVGPGLEGEDVTRLLEVLRERIPGRRAGF